MRKLKCNNTGIEKRFLTIPAACDRYSLGRDSMKNYAESVNGLKRIGRRVLIDIDAVDKALIKGG